MNNLELIAEARNEIEQIHDRLSYWRDQLAQAELQMQQAQTLIDSALQQIALNEGRLQTHDWYMERLHEEGDEETTQQFSAPFAKRTKRT